MSTNNFDKAAVDANILDRLEKLEQLVFSTTRRNVETERLSNIAPEIGELDFQAVDDQGRLRMIMSAINLLEELGISAHFAGLDEDGVPQFWISADNGKGTFGGGLITIGTDGIVASLLGDV